MDKKTRGKTILRDFIKANVMIYPVARVYIKEQAPHWFIKASKFENIHEYLSGGWKASQNMWQTQSAIIQSLIKIYIYWILLAYLELYHFVSSTCPNLPLNHLINIHECSQAQKPCQTNDIPAPPHKHTQQNKSIHLPW